MIEWVMFWWITLRNMHRNVAINMKIINMKMLMLRPNQWHIKIWEFKKKSEIWLFLEKYFLFCFLCFFLEISFLSRGTLRFPCAETWLTVYRTISIRKQWLNRPDSGPHKMIIHTLNLFELTRFWWITLRKVHRKSCREYV